MKHAEILAALFPAGHSVVATDTLLMGNATLADGKPMQVLGVINQSFVGCDTALTLASQVLAVTDQRPLLVLMDSSSQRMSRRDELLGLNEALAHLTKTMWHAHHAGRRTIGVLYGGCAAGAFIATALACEVLVALPGAHPMVMDLPSMARVTKLPLEALEKKAATTPVFAPGLDNLFATGAIDEVWDPAKSLAAQLQALLAKPSPVDVRAALGKQRGGRLKAADIAAEVQRLAEAHG